jgi:hypothetical protein
MNSTTKQRIVAIFIGVVMLASMAEIGLLRNVPGNTQEAAKLPDAVNRKLTLLEMRDALTSGKVLIEYFYNETCANCTAKENMYKEFVASDQFNGYVMLSYGVWNETSDWMLDATGTQTRLDNISDTTQLKKLICSDEIRMFSKPNVCVLESL